MLDFVFLHETNLFAVVAVKYEMIEGKQPECILT